MLYTVKEAAQMLKLTDRTIRKYVHDGKIKVVRFGRRGKGQNMRITDEELKRFIGG
jgi:excisionase family DNA binding protein